ncbi:MAG: RIP metalloprotease RseP [bacterium]
MMITILATIFVLGVLVLVHELGHFLAAKLFRIRVDRFSLGYPPKIVGKKIGDTEYCLSWIPFGGYVKIAGMVDESLDKEQLSKEPEPWEYRSKPWIQRVLVVLAGPLMNIGFALAVFVCATLIYGVAEQIPGTTVGSLVEGMPAERAGIRPEDKIISIDGQSVSSWEQMTKTIRRSPGRSLSIGLIRVDSAFVTTVVPDTAQSTNAEVTESYGQIGIWPKMEMRRVGPGKAFATGGATMFYFSKLIFGTVVKLVTRKESIRSIGGPVFIAQLAGESARLGLGSLVLFMAFLSINLGILNLLPIPVLDGGHMLFLSIEGIIRRQIPIKLKLIIQQVFMFLLLSLMIFILYNDVIRVIHR